MWLQQREREGERERERERAKRAINFPTCHDQPNINFLRISHSLKEIVRVFRTTDAAFVWIKFLVLWKVDLDGRIILRWICRNWDVGYWTGLSRLRIDTCEFGNEILGFNKMGGISLFDENRLGSDEGLCSVVCVNNGGPHNH